MAKKPRTSLSDRRPGPTTLSEEQLARFPVAGGMRMTNLDEGTGTSWTVPVDDDDIFRIDDQ